MTDSEGAYRFVTIKPGAYPWANHPNAWRAAAHPLLAVRPGVHAAAGHPDVLSRRSAVLPGPDLQLRPDGGAGAADLAVQTSSLTEPDWALGYGWDIVLRGRGADHVRGRSGRMSARLTPVPDREPLPGHRAALAGWPVRGDGGHAGRDHHHRRGLGRGREPVPDALVEAWQADPDGRFDHPGDPRGGWRQPSLSFRGLGRCLTSPGGSFRIVTLKPGPLPSPDGGTEAPHRRRVGVRRAACSAGW